MRGDDTTLVSARGTGGEKVGWVAYSHLLGAEAPAVVPVVPLVFRREDTAEEDRVVECGAVIAHGDHRLVVGGRCVGEKGGVVRGGNGGILVVSVRVHAELEQITKRGEKSLLVRGEVTRRENFVPVFVAAMIASSEPWSNEKGNVFLLLYERRH